jgi:ABC-type transport system involved in cytochrome c biogenesis permease subunit
MPSGGAAAIEGGIVATLGRMLFFPAAAVESRGKKKEDRAEGYIHPSRTRVSDPPERSAGGDEALRSSTGLLATLDQCNLVVLQLAFWILGTAIVLGAVWADQSWGRPWGWDPKETFALVTWIVYLVIVHVRVATENKAWWTAVLSIVGFFVMLFNWIGVNFFLVGLHSYA